MASSRAMDADTVRYGTPAYAELLRRGASPWSRRCDYCECLIPDGDICRECETAQTRSAK